MSPAAWEAKITLLIIFDLRVPIKGPKSSGAKRTSQNQNNLESYVCIIYNFADYFTYEKLMDNISRVGFTQDRPYLTILTRVIILLPLI